MRKNKFSHRIHKFKADKPYPKGLFNINRLFYYPKCKTCGENFWDGKHEGEAINIPKYKRQFRIKEITSHCHAYHCWINFEGKPVCGHYNTSGPRKGYCCEQVQSKVYANGVLFNVEDIVIRN